MIKTIWFLFEFYRKIFKLSTETLLVEIKPLVV